MKKIWLIITTMGAFFRLTLLFPYILITRKLGKECKGEVKNLYPDKAKKIALEMMERFDPTLDTLCVEYNRLLTEAIARRMEGCEDPQILARMRDITKHPGLRTYLTPLRGIVEELRETQYPIPNYLFRTAYKIFHDTPL